MKLKESIKYEIFRKIFHISTLLFLMLYIINFWLGFTLSLIFILLYFTSEILRVKGIRLIFFEDISEIISKSKRVYSGEITYSPLFLVIGIFVVYLFIPPPSSYVGIISVCLGDGLASILGKAIPSFKFLNGKTFAGSTTMCIITTVAYYYFFGNIFVSVLIGILGSVIEIINFKEFDNLLIPVSIGLISFLINL